MSGLDGRPCKVTGWLVWEEVPDWKQRCGKPIKNWRDHKTSDLTDLKYWPTWVVLSREWEEAAFCESIFVNKDFLFNTPLLKSVNSEETLVLRNHVAEMLTLGWLSLDIVKKVLFNSSCRIAIARHFQARLNTFMTAKRIPAFFKPLQW